MSRLIDADDLIEYIKIWDVGHSISSDQKEFIDCVNRQLTTFDVDKVVEQLQAEFKKYLIRTIEIVKTGQIDENKALDEKHTAILDTEDMER